MQSCPTPCSKGRFVRQNGTTFTVRTGALLFGHPNQNHAHIAGPWRDQLTFSAGEYKTLAGLIDKHLSRVPEIGDTVHLPGCKITVEARGRHRLAQVSFERTQDCPTKELGIADTKEEAPKAITPKLNEKQGDIPNCKSPKHI